MYNLNQDEIMMVDGGGDGGYSMSGAAAIGTIARGTVNYWGRNTVKNAARDLAGGGGNINTNVSQGSYQAYGQISGGGMAGSPTGGRGYGY